MAGTYSQSYVPTTGDTITVARWNSAWNDHYNGNDFTGLGDYSASAAEMQTNTDPYPSSAESLATDGKGELERLRYQLKTQFGLTQWYHDVTVVYETFLTNVASYRRPNLVYVSATQMDVENNTGTANQTKILFPDGTSRSVTEDTSVAHKYRRFDITADAEFTTGTEDSGLRAALTEATNTWYAIYAVKSTIAAANFVLAGDTTLPLQANFATLNTAYGTNGWVYLGMIRNGDNSGATGDILAFTQHGSITNFSNACTGSGTISIVGLRLANTAGATTLDWTYAAGTGAAQVPDHIDIGHVICNGGARSAAVYGISTSANNRLWVLWTGSTIETRHSIWLPLGGGVEVGDWAATTSNVHDINLAGWVDGVLSGGTNPIL